MNKSLLSKFKNILSNRWKLTFLLRSVIFLSVVFIYLMVNFVFLHQNKLSSTKYEAINKEPSNSLGRRILSISEEKPEISNLDNTYFNSTKHNLKSSSFLKNCSLPAILEFPSDGLSRKQRQQGWIFVHILVVLYCFWLLAAICNDYLVPAIEQICSALPLQKDVVAATIMAAASSSPEMFMNCIGTFVTKGDIGVGSIVGSAVFNILAVPACCGFFIKQNLKLDWWPVTRDCVMYCLAVLALICCIYDGKVMWYEALTMVLGYFGYLSIMYCNDQLACKARQLVAKFRRRTSLTVFKKVHELTPLLKDTLNHNVRLETPTGKLNGWANTTFVSYGIEDDDDDDEMEEFDFAEQPWKRRSDGSLFEFVIRWPITTVLWMSIPDGRKHKKLVYMTILIAILWIGALSYVVAFVITIIGDTLNIPDSVMGLTILAAGMSVPEAISSIIVTKQGHGAMGISNSIGSNTFDILLCLGLPWFIKSYFMPSQPNEGWVLLHSNGLSYSAIILLGTLAGLYVVLALNHFILNWKIGLVCSVMYLGFMIIATLIELNVFFSVNLPTCKH